MWKMAVVTSSVVLPGMSGRRGSSRTLQSKQSASALRSEPRTSRIQSHSDIRYQISQTYFANKPYVLKNVYCCKYISCNGVLNLLINVRVHKRLCRY
jgi:hypothetical protein